MSARSPLAPLAGHPFAAKQGKRASFVLLSHAVSSIFRTFFSISTTSRAAKRRLLVRCVVALYLHDFWSMTKGEWLMKGVHLRWARERERERERECWGRCGSPCGVWATGWLRVSILLPCRDGTFLGGSQGWLALCVCVCVCVCLCWEKMGTIY